MISLRQGDCLELMPDIPDASVDLILTDPPYGTTRNSWDKPFDLTGMWKEFKRIIKPNGAILICAQQPFACDVINSNRQMFRYEWVWQKNNATGFLNSKKMPLKAHEQVLVFYKKLPTYNPQMRGGYASYRKTRNSQSKNYGKQKKTAFASEDKRYPVDVLTFVVERGKHPTQKPLALMEYMINTYSNPGMVVFDPFMGSGTTGIAAKNLGRDFIGIEKDASYFQIVQERMGG